MQHTPLTPLHLLTNIRCPCGETCMHLHFYSGVLAPPTECCNTSADILNPRSVTINYKQNSWDSTTVISWQMCIVKWTSMLGCDPSLSLKSHSAVIIIKNSVGQGGWDKDTIHIILNTVPSEWFGGCTFKVKKVLSVTLTSKHIFHQFSLNSQ